MDCLYDGTKTTFDSDFNSSYLMIDRDVDLLFDKPDQFHKIALLHGDDCLEMEEKKPRAKDVPRKTVKIGRMKQWSGRNFRKAAA